MGLVSILKWSTFTFSAEIRKARKERKSRVATASFENKKPRRQTFDSVGEGCLEYRQNSPY
jgi:hypothetical protein